MARFRHHRPSPAVVALAREGVTLEQVVTVLGMSRAQVAAQLDGRKPVYPALLRVVAVLADDETAAEVQAALLAGRTSGHNRAGD